MLGSSNDTIDTFGILEDSPVDAGESADLPENLCCLFDLLSLCVSPMLAAHKVPCLGISVENPGPLQMHQADTGDVLPELHVELDIRSSLGLGTLSSLTPTAGHPDFGDSSPVVICSMGLGT